MNQKVQTLKGFRDFLPQQAKKRQFVISKLKSVFESFGFEPLETPTLEYEEILTGKYGEEADMLMYRFEDNGGRRVAMRYDQTVPLARVAAQYQNDLPLPFKRYQIQSVFRAENTQKGRFREFLQCDIDTVGTSSLGADAEIVAIVDKSLSTLGFTSYKILINDRAIFGDIPVKAITIIDKLKKIGAEAVQKELEEKGFSSDILSTIIHATAPESIEKIRNIAKSMGVNTDNIVFEPTLARGLDYYTGMILEVEINGYEAGSIAGGGRYDNLIGLFATQSIPAVGLAFGFDRTVEAMETLNLFPADLSTTKILVTVFSPELATTSVELVTDLRSKNINAEVYLDIHVKMEKQLKYADKKGIPYVVIIGPDEKAQNKVTLKNLGERTQKTISVESLASEIR
jgi:histidyl-tRNA synthetase